VVLNMSDEFYISLFDDPKTDEANGEFKKLFEKFGVDLKALRKKWEDLGAEDTEVGDHILSILADYID
jgi:hypothetical protein